MWPFWEVHTNGELRFCSASFTLYEASPLKEKGVDRDMKYGLKTKDDDMNSPRSNSENL